MRAPLFIVVALLVALSSGCALPPGLFPVPGAAHPVQSVKLGPEWTKLLPFKGHLLPSASLPALHWTAGFHIDGATLRVVGVITSDNPDAIGLSLVLQQKRKRSTKWVDSSVQLAPHDNASRPSGGTVAVDWYTDSPLKPGEYRLGILRQNYGTTYALSVYVRK